eukprot:m.153605 g.153605  ORF g.153605 m.153605 type:complete len:922 (-) comp15121_c5_seq3:31-2796(-)
MSTETAQSALPDATVGQEQGASEHIHIHEQKKRGRKRKDAPLVTRIPQKWTANQAAQPGVPGTNEHGLPISRKFGRPLHCTTREPKAEDFDSHEAYEHAWRHWRHVRDSNNESVRRTRMNKLNQQKARARSRRRKHAASRAAKAAAALAADANESHSHAEGDASSTEGDGSRDGDDDDDDDGENHQQQEQHQHQRQGGDEHREQAASPTKEEDDEALLARSRRRRHHLDHEPWSTHDDHEEGDVQDEGEDDETFNPKSRKGRPTRGSGNGARPRYAAYSGVQDTPEGTRLVKHADLSPDGTHKMRSHRTSFSAPGASLSGARTGEQSTNIHNTHISTAITPTAATPIIHVYAGATIPPNPPLGFSNGHPDTASARPPTQFTHTQPQSQSQVQQQSLLPGGPAVGAQPPRKRGFMPTTPNASSAFSSVIHHPSHSPLSPRGSSGAQPKTLSAPFLGPSLPPPHRALDLGPLLPPGAGAGAGQLVPASRAVTSLDILANLGAHVAASGVDASASDNTTRSKHTPPSATTVNAQNPIAANITNISTAPSATAAPSSLIYPRTAAASTQYVAGSTYNTDSTRSASPLGASYPLTHAPKDESMHLHGLTPATNNVFSVTGSAAVPPGATAPAIGNVFPSAHSSRVHTLPPQSQSAPYYPAATSMPSLLPPGSQSLPAGPSRTFLPPSMGGMSSPAPFGTLPFAPGLHLPFPGYSLIPDIHTEARRILAAQLAANAGEATAVPPPVPGLGLGGAIAADMSAGRVATAASDFTAGAMPLRHGAAPAITHAQAAAAMQGMASSSMIPSPSAAASLAGGPPAMPPQMHMSPLAQTAAMPGAASPAAAAAVAAQMAALAAMSSPPFGLPPGALGLPGMYPFGLMGAPGSFPSFPGPAGMAAATNPYLFNPSAMWPWPAQPSGFGMPSSSTM